MNTINEYTILELLDTSADEHVRRPDFIEILDIARIAAKCEDIFAALVVAKNTKLACALIDRLLTNHRNLCDDKLAVDINKCTGAPSYRAVNVDVLNYLIERLTLDELNRQFDDKQGFKSTHIENILRRVHIDDAYLQTLAIIVRKYKLNQQKPNIGGRPMLEYLVLNGFGGGAQNDLRVIAAAEYIIAAGFYEISYDALLLTSKYKPHSNINRAVERAVKEHEEDKTLPLSDVYDLSNSFFAKKDAAQFNEYVKRANQN
jgi:hypothetical protein